MATVIALFLGFSSVNHLHYIVAASLSATDHKLIKLLGGFIELVCEQQHG